MADTLEDILKRQRQSLGITGSESAEPGTQPVAGQTDSNKNIWDSPYLSGKYTEDQINTVRNFNPMDGSVLDLYVKTFQKPEIDEQALQKNRTVGAIGDSLKLLGQMFGATKGARIDNLSPAQSLTAQALKKEEEMRKLYQQKAGEWDKGYYNALLHDRQMQNNYAANLETRMRADIKQNDALEREASRHAEQKEQWEKTFAHNVEQSKIRNSQTERQLKIQQQRMNAAAKQEKEDVLFITPNENDTNPGIVTHSNLGRIMPVKIAKNEIESLAAKAKTDKDFVAQHPEFFQKIKTEENYKTVYKTTLKPNVDAKTLAAAYYQDMYDRKQTKTESLLPDNDVSGALLP
jgi:hypothetical protein